MSVDRGRPEVVDPRSFDPKTDIYLLAKADILLDNEAKSAAQ